MKIFRCYLFFCNFLFVYFLSTVSQASQPKVVYPCRIKDSGNNDLFIMTLGGVQTPLAQGMFVQIDDAIMLNDHTAILHYFRDSLGVKFFEPGDKHYFPLPPSGWCSWYYYYQEINEDEIKRNAQWLAENLKDFGATYVQIDDGWQGSGHGLGENRDWSTIDKRFPHGMDGLASSIKQLGLVPGLWLAPHGQSNPDVVKKYPNAFLLKNDTSASNTWEGKFLVNPSTSEGISYLKELFQQLTSWGYEYFKIDGQPIVIDEYKRLHSMFKNSTSNPDELYRNTISTIRNTIGEKRYLLGCWGIPLDGVGIMNGSRTGGDVLLGWDGFMSAVDATMKYYFLHNVVWYSDPDVMLLRSPLTIDQARAWATLQGLTGQALMSSDRMMDLSNDRVEILKRVMPAVDIRPLDLFPSQRNKRIWDLKVNHPRLPQAGGGQVGRQYDVVGVFNFNQTKSDQVYLSWSELGITDTGAVHIFDFWNKEYLGCWKGGISIELPSTSCRVLTLVPSTGRVELVSTSRHITQGWIDLVSTDHNVEGTVWSGKSKLIKNDPYELRFAFPRGMNFVVKKVVAGDLPVSIANHQGWAAVQFTSPTTTEVEWRVEFTPSDEYYSFPTHKPDDLSFSAQGLDAAKLQWSHQYYLYEGYQVYLNGKLLGYTSNNSFMLRNLDPRQSNTVQVSSVWQDGTESKEKAEIRFSFADQMSKEYYLSNLEPTRATIGWGTIGSDKTVDGRPLTVGGKTFRKGIGTHANSDIEYKLYGMFDSFTAQVGIDDEINNGNGSVEFSVLVDGKQVWKSGVMKRADAAKSINVNIHEAKSLLLRVTDGGDGIDYDHADWLEAKVK